ncbi:MAG TPA: DUF4249 domain-containing protein [Adhaeribacter sp.]|nr:DUF4249 domain-containing protein [Adhaeribacter sp.]
MKQKTQKYIGWLLSLLPLFGLASCEMIVDVDLPPHQPKLVVNCLLTPDSLVTVRVYQSLGPLDRQDVSEIRNATVILLEDGVEVANLPFISGNQANYYQSPVLKPQPLKNYTLIVKAPGFPDAQGSCMIPGKVPILNATIRDSAGLDEGGSYYSRLVVTFQDPAQTKNYYNLSGQYLYSYSPAPWDPNAPRVYNYYPIYFFSNLKDVEEGGDNGMLLKDDLFNGRQYDLTLNFYPPYGGGGSSPAQQDTFRIAFKNASSEYYEYYRKLQPHLYNQGGDIFSGEPVVMPNNIQGGYGIFAGYSQDTLLVVK